MREKSFIGEKRSKMISWNKTAIMVRKKKTSHGCLIKDGGGHTLGLFLAPLIPCQIPPPIAPIENAPPKSFKMTYGLNIHITKVSLRPSFPRGGKGGVLSKTFCALGWEGERRHTRGLVRDRQQT